MRLHLHSVNDELARRGYKAELAKGAGYFFFRGGEADGWIDTAVAVRKINSLTLKQWIEEYRRLKELNHQMGKAARASGAEAVRPAKDKRS
jgi:hypothetical protein